MKVIYNSDGSFNYCVLTDLIKRGDNNASFIDFSIRDRNLDGYTLSAYAELPNEEIAGPFTLSQVDDSYRLLIGSALTIYEGTVKLSVRAFNSLTEETLFTSKINLTINPAVIVPNETQISANQYDLLLAAIDSKFNLLKYPKATYCFGDEFMPGVNVYRMIGGEIPPFDYLDIGDFEPDDAHTLNNLFDSIPTAIGSDEIGNFCVSERSAQIARETFNLHYSTPGFKQLLYGGFERTLLFFVSNHGRLFCVYSGA